MNKEYIASEYHRMHAKQHFSGGCLGLYMSEIQRLVKQYECRNVLDYGCGKASCHKGQLPDVTLYDPYYELYSKKPEGNFDMVICTDVLEHIPSDEVGKVLADLINCTNEVLFLSICTKPAKKKFRNGENVHLTVKPKEWWEKMLENGKGIKIVRHYT